MNQAVNSKKNFITIWTGQLVSGIGSGLTGFALGVWVYQKTGMATYYALIILCTILPSILIRPLGGVLADRFSRRNLMLISDFGASIGSLFIGVMFWTNQLEIWHIYVGMCFSSMFVGIGLPAYFSAISQLIPENFYAQANGMIQAAGSAQYLVSPLLAGILLPVIGMYGILLIDFTTFLFAVFATFSVKLPLRVADDINKGIGNLLNQIWEAILYLKTKSGLLVLAGILFIVNFLMGFLISLIGPMILSFATPQLLGIGESASAVGMLISSILILFLPQPKNLVKGSMSFLFLMGLSYSLIGIRANFYTILIPCFVFFFTLPFINTYIDIIIRKIVAQQIQGRVYALTGMLIQTGLIISYMVSGPLSDKIFEPLLAEKGLLADSVGRVIGVGAGRGIGFIFIVIGILICCVAIGAYAQRDLRKLEAEIPKLQASQ